ncbi:hypothetical protein [Pseudoalteromonas sp. R3]|uniref:hypothetical protein n=1 Tax=Pseudoalteromonas sp. R3 TaxID=1709477 RepID=UPI000FDE627C|nr:hypothetical protein [Pseudoalteromonas sp. R3]AZZ97243.1 hypothetical protein ELR70_08860 [Pseudoalteromonas sp. R3]
MKKTIITKAATLLAFALMSGMSASALAKACTNKTNLRFQSDSAPYRIDLTNMEDYEVHSTHHEREFGGIASVEVGTTTYTSDRGNNWSGDASFISDEVYIPFIVLKKLPEFGTHTLTIAVQTNSETCSQVACNQSTSQSTCSMVVTYTEKTTPYFLNIDNLRIQQNQPVTLNYTAKDDGRDLKKVVITKDSNELKTCNSNGTSSLSCSVGFAANSLPVGNNYVQATATDSFGNSTRKAVHLFVNEPNLAPAISNITIKNNNVLMPGDDALVSFTITDQNRHSYNQLDLDTFKINAVQYKGSSHCTSSTSNITCTDVPIAATPGQGAMSFLLPSV